MKFNAFVSKACSVMFSALKDPHAALFSVDWSTPMSSRHSLKNNVKVALLCFPLYVSATPAHAARARACGVEAFNTGSGAQCGAAVFKTGTGAQCGATVYRQGAGEAQCGSTRKERWSDWGHDCEKSLRTDLGDALLLSSAFGLMTGESQTRVHDWSVQTRHKCIAKIANTCRHPDFGVEPYPWCRHPDFGVESYPTCRHPDFGIERYRDCAIMTEEEVTAYAASTSAFLPAIAAGYTSAIAAYNSVQKSESKLACVIKDYEASGLPFVQDIVTRLKQNFESTTGKPYSSDGVSCNPGESLVNEILVAEPNGDIAHDSAIASLKEHRNLLLKQREETTKLLADVVAVSSEAHRLQLQEVQHLIEEIMVVEKGGGQ